MRVLITGSTGQLGTELLRSTPAGVEAVGLSRSQCDITDAAAVEEAVSSIRPCVMINTAAYTAVDKAEEEPHQAFAVNATGAGNVARAARRIDARMIHISTDYVFDGNRATPYPPNAETNPVNVYGVSKLVGETEVISADPRALIVRTGWLYSAHGKNFMRTILAALQARRAIHVVDDQLGVPSSALDLASAIWSCVELPRLNRIQHWVNEGSATWYEFAVAIREIALEERIVESAAAVIPISTAEFGSPASRPRYSVLDASNLWKALGGPPKSWKKSLMATVAEFKLRSIGGAPEPMSRLSGTDERSY